jgi:hypothetical protein
MRMVCIALAEFHGPEAPSIINMLELESLVPGSRLASAVLSVIKDLMEVSYFSLFAWK